MPKNKLQRFAELKTFPNVYQYLHFERGTDFRLKGKWNAEHFRNDHPIVLELGCGKGDYALGLAEKYPDKNFIGIDLKGARIWRGAKTALEKKLSNVAFLRSQIDFIEYCFARDEVSEIWITFPDPQKEKARKRLTHPVFLNRYKNILKPGGLIHLKTDNLPLHEYTLEVIEENKLPLIYANRDIYGVMDNGQWIMDNGRRTGDNGQLIMDNGGQALEDVTGIQTFYEKQFLAEEKKITYLRFVLS